jgi:hypothetical protein
MKKLLLTLLICTILIVGVTAEIIINSITSQTELDKILRDAILTKIPTQFDSKGKALIKEIKPTITKYCSDKDCIVKLNQAGLVNDNTIVIDKYKYNCSMVFDENEQVVLINNTETGQMENRTYIRKTNAIEVCNPILKTEQEIDNEILEKTNEIFVNYGDAILKENNYSKVGEGTIEVIEE